jgi:hypothetical protein
MSNLVKILGNTKILGTAVFKVIPWLLATGSWSDEGIWKDVETWIE